MAEAVHRQDIVLPVGDAALEGTLSLPQGAGALVVFAHGSGSSRHSPRNRFVAETLNADGLGTLLFDLLTAEEHALDQLTRQWRFDVRLLEARLTGALDWIAGQPQLRHLAVGLFGSSTGAAGALLAAAARPAAVGAVVSRGGRPDLAGGALARVRAPVLLIVGGDDLPVIGMNRDAARQLRAEHRIEIIPGATHLFEEPGALEEVTRLASAWFRQHLDPQRSA